MQTSSRLEQVPLPIAVREQDLQSGSGRILSSVFETLDRADIPYCVLHGYEDYPRRIKSDVDCMIHSGVTPAQLLIMLHDNSTRIGAEVVRCDGYHVVLKARNPEGSACFLTLDMSVDYEVDGYPFHAGAEVVESRRRHKQFWVPAAHIEFGCYLVRTISKDHLEGDRTRRLSTLFQQDAARCEAQVARLWGAGSTELIVASARSGDWREVEQQLGNLRTELRRRSVLRHPGRFAGNRLNGFVERARRVWRPGGLNVVLLGPDGAGKSSVVEALPPSLAPAFARSVCWGFAPPLLNRLLRRGGGPTDQPHALPPRSFVTSLARAAYWFVCHTFGYVYLHLALARSTLVLNDRHFIDILVDIKRYRYGGPLWLLRLIWRLIPKPDLIILLDAPPEVLQARKQEVSFEETAEQRRAYLALVRPLRNGHVVNGAQSLDHVVGDVGDVILRHLATRIARRFGLEPHASCVPRQSLSAEISGAVTPMAKER